MKTAKRDIEAIESDLRAKNPELFTKRSAGCGGAAALMLAVIFSVGVLAIWLSASMD